MHPALELRRQDEVHEHDRQHEGEHEVHAGLLLLLGAAGEAGGEGLGHVQILRLLHQEIHDLLRRISGLHVRQDHDHAPAVEAVDHRGAGAFFERHQIVQSHVRAVRGRNLDLGDAGHVVARARVGAHVHFVFFAAFVVAGGFLSADQHVQRCREVLHPHAEVRGLFAIDAHGQLRLADDEVRVDVRRAEARILDGLGQLLRVLVELHEVRSADPEHHLGIRTAAELVHRRDLRTQVQRLILRQHLFADAVHDRVLVVALGSVAQLHVDRGQVQCLLRIVADGDDRVRDAVQLAHARGDRLGDGLRRRHAGPFRRTHGHGELSLVVVREERLVDDREERNGREQHHEHQGDDHPAVGHRPVQHGHVRPFHERVQAL